MIAYLSLYVMCKYNTWNLQEAPPIARNSPRVAGSIFWSRGLLRRIAEPMKVFRDAKFVSSLKVCESAVSLIGGNAT